MVDRVDLKEQAYSVTNNFVKKKNVYINPIFVSKNSFHVKMF